MGQDKLQQFERSSDEWTGPVSDTSLFNIWKKMKADIERNTDSANLEINPEELAHDSSEPLIEIFG